MPRLVLVVPMLVLAAGCQRRHAPSAEPGPPQSAELKPPAPPELLFSLTSTLDDGGMDQVPLKANEPAQLDPTQQLELQANTVLSNARVRLFDEADRALESDDVASVDGGVTHYGIHLLSPLKPGHRYALVVDPETGAAFSDADGGTYVEKRFALQTSGERPKEVRAPPAHKPSRHHRRH